MTQRRKRSDFSRDDCFRAIETFAARIKRFGESSDASMFTRIERDEINVQILIAGAYGDADDFFEALRVLGNFKLPANRAAVSEEPSRES